MDDKKKIIPTHEVEVGAPSGLVPWYCRCGTNGWAPSQEAAEQRAADHLRGIEYQRSMLTPELIEQREAAIDLAAQSLFLAEFLGIFRDLPHIPWEEQGELSQNAFRARIRNQLSTGPVPEEFR